MGPIEFNKRRITLLLAGCLAFYIVYHGLSFARDDLKDAAAQLPIPGHLNPIEHTLTPSAPDLDEIWDLGPDPSPALDDVSDTESSTLPPVQLVEHLDLHPIAQLMKDADAQWRPYETDVSTTFRQTVEKYRSQYGRHPPPGFTEWYKFARHRDVFNIDEFKQVMDDLRPFWAIDASEIRMRAAHMWENFDFGVSVIHIRNHKVVKVENPSWRSDTMEKVLEKFIEHLPDMDIPMNRLDQPRVVVPWEGMQEHLRMEYDARVMPPEVMDSFTKNQQDLRDMSFKDKEEDNTTRLNDEWFFAPGQQYMKIAAKGCPPESPARSNICRSLKQISFTKNQ